MRSASATWWRPAPSGSGQATLAARESDSGFAFAALMALTFILLLAPQAFLPLLARLRIALLTGVLAVAAHCWTRFAARQPIMRFSREIWLALALLVWVVATLPAGGTNAGDLPASIARGDYSEWGYCTPPLSCHDVVTPEKIRDVYPKALIVFWLLSNTVTTLSRLRTVAWGLTVTALPLAATGIWNFLSGHTFAGSLSGRIVGYDAPLTGDPNDLALMLNLILPLTVALLLISRRPALRGLLICLLVLDASAIVVTFSRAGFVTLLTTLALYLLSLPRAAGWKWAIILVMVAVATVPLLPPEYLSRVDTIFNAKADTTGSTQERWRDMGLALGYAVNHPIVGAGLGMNVMVLNYLRGPLWQPVHNVYLQYAVDLGWVGLGLFVLLLLSCIRRAARLRDSCAGVPWLKELSTLANAIRITLIAFGVAGLAYPQAYHYYFYYFAGLAVALGPIHQAEVGSPVPVGVR